MLAGSVLNNAGLVNNGTINGETNMGDGNNLFQMQGGRLNGNVIQGTGDDIGAACTQLAGWAP